MNRLKNIDIIKNVCLFPHGILDYKPYAHSFFKLKTKAILNQSFNIASYGFCLPNKGYKELIHAIRLLRDRALNIKLTIYSAIYNESYKWVYHEALDLIEKLELKEHVNIEDKYLDTDQILKNLSSKDFLVYSYQSSNESSSASVREGLATLRPVLVTPSTVFNDVSNIVEYLPGFTPEDISNGIYNFCFSNRFHQTFSSKYYQERSKLLLERRFSRLSNKLINIIKSLEINGT